MFAAPHGRGLGGWAAGKGLETVWMDDYLLLGLWNRCQAVRGRLVAFFAARRSAEARRRIWPHGENGSNAQLDVDIVTKATAEAAKTGELRRAEMFT